MQDDGTTWLRYRPPRRRRASSRRAEVLGGQGRSGAHPRQGGAGGRARAWACSTTRPRRSGEFVPGVEIHAQVVENLFNGVTLARPAHRRARRGGGAASLCGFIAHRVRAAPVARCRASTSSSALVVLLVRRGHHRVPPLPPAASTPRGPRSAPSRCSAASSWARSRRPSASAAQLREQAARMAGEVDAARRIQMGLLPDPRETLGDDRRFRRRRAPRARAHRRRRLLRLLHGRRATTSSSWSPTCPARACPRRSSWRR